MDGVTFDQIGKQCIGLQDKRGQCQLDKVESLPAHDSHQPQTIYTAASEMLFEGKLEPFLPFIYLGEYLHIGHHTAFGFGQYRICGLGDNLPPIN